MKSWHLLALSTSCVFTAGKIFHKDNSEYDIVVGNLQWSGYSAGGAFEAAVRDAVSPGLNRRVIAGSLNTAPTNNRTLILWSDGCKVQNQLNCTAACLDHHIGSKVMWNDKDYGATLHNCMVFPWIVALQSAGLLTPYALQQARRFNIPGSTDLVVGDKWPLINSCTRAYCRTLGGTSAECVITPQMIAHSDYPQLAPGFDQAFWTLAINTTFCENLDTFINSDLGGIGVLISYIAQTSLALAAWIFYQTYQGFVRYTWKRFRKSSQRRNGSYLAPLIAALDDFQKAQICLVAAVQAAVNVALHNTSLLAATSPAQLRYNVNFVSISSLSGFSSLGLVYATLRSAKTASVLLGLSTTATMGLCLFTVLKSSGLSKNFDATSDFSSVDTGLEACGGSWPVQICGTSKAVGLTATYSTMVFGSISICCGVVFCAMIVCDLIVARSRRWTLYLGFTSALRLLTPVVKSLICSAHLFPAILTTFSLYCYIRILLFNSGTLVDASNWNLGQILAVTIWVPVLADCANFFIFGIEEGSERRLVKPYKVMKQDDKDSSSDEEDEDDKRSSFDSTASTHSRIQAARQLPFFRSSFDDTASTNSRVEAARALPYFHSQNLA